VGKRVKFLVLSLSQPKQSQFKARGNRQEATGATGWSFGTLADFLIYDNSLLGLLEIFIFPTLAYCLLPIALSLKIATGGLRIKPII
jgi:hypothetical protein